MTIDEKRAMKAACMQAAATLIAARAGGKYQIDAEECIKLAALTLCPRCYDRLARACVTPYADEC